MTINKLEYLLLKKPTHVPAAFRRFFVLLAAWLCAGAIQAIAQPDAGVVTKLDPPQIMVGDRARLFLEVTNHPSKGTLYWSQIPDTFNSLEVIEKGKIDTITNGDVVTYKQRLLITGFDSGVFKIPSFYFALRSSAGDSFYIQSDSLNILVQTVAVDTTQAFKPIKNIIYVKASWLDYLWYIVGGVLLLAGIVVLTVYLARRKKPVPVIPEGPKETLQEEALRLLNELEAKQLWQNDKIKEYYVDLTAIVRGYIESRFLTAALELTTDELLQKVQVQRELMPHYTLLSAILHTADMAKFAKAQPLPQEHIDAIDKARQFIKGTTPAPVMPPVAPQPPTDTTL
jgi:hypothetical protein